MNNALPGTAKILNGGFRLDVATTPSSVKLSGDAAEFPFVRREMVEIPRRDFSISVRHHPDIFRMVPATNYALATT